MPKVCDMDCLNCKFPDCIKNDVYYDSASYKNRSEAAKKHAREHQAKLRKEAKDKGLCVVCRKNAADHGVTCEDCFRKNSNYQKLRYEKKRKEKEYSDSCHFCDRKRMKDKKVCEIHYAIYCAAAQKARESDGYKKFMEHQKEIEHRRILVWRTEHHEKNVNSAEKR